jgi:hypothetical protein
MKQSLTEVLSVLQPVSLPDVYAPQPGMDSNWLLLASFDFPIEGPTIDD